MNIQTQMHRPRGRLSDLSPFDPQDAFIPPTVTLARPLPQSHECQEPDGELAYGCVAWFRYPDKGRRGQHPDAP